VSEDNAKPDKTPKRIHRPGRLGVLISLGLIVVVAGAVALVAFALPARQRDVPPAGPRPVNVEVMTVRAIPLLPDTFVAPGNVEPNRVVSVAAEVAARVEELPVEEGEPVRAGEVIARLNTDLLQAEVDRTRAQAAYDRREYRRLLGVLEQGAATRKEVDQTRSMMEISQAAYEAAAARLARATVEAPVDGVLNRLPLERGEYVTPGVVVAEIVDTRKVKVAVDVPERDVVFLRAGEPAEVIHERGSTRGPITYISELADPRTRTSRVEVTVDNPLRVLRSGQMVRVVFVRRQVRDAVMVPLDAIVPMEDARAVYVVQDGKARRRIVQIEPLLILGQYVRVSSGLSPGDRLIVEGRQYVGPDQPVNVLGEQPTPRAEELLQGMPAAPQPASKPARP
jgi:membrane fusion protein (multidrug efflux system)